MSTKKVAIGGKPTAKAETKTANQWVENPSDAEETEPMKRLTVDIPASLHRRIKAACAMRDAKIADEVRDLLHSKYGNT